jgi:hypothetical protein
MRSRSSLHDDDASVELDCDVHARKRDAKHLGEEQNARGGLKISEKSVCAA